jgi:hypothetical protein
MTKATAASRKSMRPAPAVVASGDGGQGTATSRKGKAPRKSLDTIVAEALETYGSPDAAVKGIEAAAVALEQASSAILAWSKIAEQWTKDGRSARAFATAVKGNPNTLSRLRSVAVLIHASRTGKGSRTLTPREAVKVANANTVGKVDALAAEMLDGKDPLGTKGKRPGAVKPHEGKSSRKSSPVKVAEVTPDQYPAVLRLILANMGKVSRNATAVEIATLAGQVQTAATQRAAALTTTRKGRTTTATTAVAI